MGYLLARDTVNGAAGKIFVTVDGKNIEVAGMRNIHTDAEIQSGDMRVVGTTTIQDKKKGVKLTGKGNIYYGSNLFLDMILEYIQTGNMPEFEISITNDDPAASIGTQTIAYYGCSLTGSIPLSVLDSEQEMLSYDFNFSYTRVARLSSFTDPTSYGS